MANKIEDSSFERWNEEMAEKYDIEAYYSESSPVIRYIESRRIHWVLEMLSPEVHQNILEVGCGAGHILSLIKRGTLHGIDLSSKMLSLAKKRLGDKAELKKCDAEALGYPDSFFDKVICSEVLEHTANPHKVLYEIHRVSRPGGIVILSIPNEKFINRIKEILIKVKIFRMFFKNIPENMEWHLHSFSLSVLRSITHGIMEEIDIKAIPNRFFPLRYVGKYKVLK